MLDNCIPPSPAPFSSTEDLGNPFSGWKTCIPEFVLMPHSAQVLFPRAGIQNEIQSALTTVLLTDVLSLPSRQSIRNSTCNALGSFWTNGPPIIRMINWISQTRYTEKTEIVETPRPCINSYSALIISMTSSKLAQTQWVSVFPAAKRSFVIPLMTTGWHPSG